MTRFSRKAEIINHFDKLINKVDIDIETCLEKCNNDRETLGELLKSTADDRRSFRSDRSSFSVKFRNPVDSSNTSIWPESTKVVDYLSQIRMRTIEELRKAQEESLRSYNSSHLKNTNESQLFANKFYFQVNLTQAITKQFLWCKIVIKRFWCFNLFTFETDFYIPPSDIDSLE